MRKQLFGKMFAALAATLATAGIATAALTWTADTVTRPGYTIVKFTGGAGEWTVPPGVTSAEVLVVGGGGGGGGSTGGGGGAGGLLSNGSFALTEGSYSVTIGEGGAGGIGGVTGTNGGNSVFGSLIAYGGGGGASNQGTTPNGSAGGSGGGASYVTSAGTGGAGTSGQGNDGGAMGAGWPAWRTGGGGGAGAVGTSSSNTMVGNGGIGISSEITGFLTWYAGGGGGGVYGESTVGTGGQGGGGSGGGDINAPLVTSGTPNTGGGGGGQGNNLPGAAGAGGSGIVIIAYESDPAQVGIALASPADNQAYSAYTPVIASATVWGGTAPYTVRFFTDLTGSYAQYGSEVTAPPYQVDLGTPPAGTYHIYAEVTDSASGSATTVATPTTFTVAANQAPVVAITAPADGSTVVMGSTVSVSASATDDGSITQVDFYVDGNLLESDTTSPYGASWTNVQPGAHVITAEALDNGGLTTTSAAVNVMVFDPLAMVWNAPTTEAFDSTTFQTGTSIANFNLRATAGGTEVWGETWTNVPPTGGTAGAISIASGSDPSKVMQAGDTGLYDGGTPVLGSGWINSHGDLTTQFVTLSGFDPTKQYLIQYLVADNRTNPVIIGRQAMMRVLGGTNDSASAVVGTYPDNGFVVFSGTLSNSTALSVVPLLSGAGEPVWNMAQLNAIRVIELVGEETPYDIWSTGNFANTFTDTDPTHDPDGDGMTNFEEFAFGLDPTSGTSVNPISDFTQLESDRLFSYTRYANSGLSYSIWTSVDLETWVEQPGALQESGEPDLVTGVQTVLVELPVQEPPSNTRFVQVKAE